MSLFVRALPVALVVVLASWLLLSNRSGSEAGPSIRPRVSQVPSMPLEASSDISSGSARREAPPDQGPPVSHAPNHHVALPSAADAVIDVTVFDRSRAAPLSGVRLYCHPLKGGDERSSRIVALAAGSKGAVGVAPLTDQTGQARFSIRPWSEHIVEARLAGAASGAVQARVPALAPHEHWALRLDVPIGLGPQFFGLVRADDRPVADAAVRVLGSDPISKTDRNAPTATDGDGLFGLYVPLGKSAIGRVDASGFGPAFFLVSPGHETPETAVQLELIDAGMLSGRVIAPVPVNDGYVVRVHLAELPDDGLNAPRPIVEAHWECRTESGHWEIEGLPAGIELRAELLSDSEEAIQSSDGIVLEPGSPTRLDWVLGGPGALTVQALRTVDGKPIENLEMWVLPNLGEKLPQLYFEPYLKEEAIRVARTDEDGVCSVYDLEASGRYYVGPAPGTGFAPVGELFGVSSLGAPAPLLVQEGQFIGGHVLDHDGLAVEGARVEAGFLVGSLVAYTDESGAYSIGPLPPGRCGLSASHPAHAPSDIAVADGGAAGVILRLRRFCALSGAVSPGRPATVSVYSLGGDYRGQTVDADVDGRFFKYTERPPLSCCASG